MRDDDPKFYLGKGVSKAVSNVNNIIGPAVIKKGFKVTEQDKIDMFMTKELDGTENKGLH